MESPLDGTLKLDDFNRQLQLTLALQSLIEADGDVAKLGPEMRERFDLPDQGVITRSHLHKALEISGNDMDSLMKEIETTGGLWEYLSALPISTPTKR